MDRTTAKNDVIVAVAFGAAVAGAGIKIGEAVQAVPVLTSPEVTNALYTLLRSDAVVGSIAFSAATIITGCRFLKSLIRDDSKS